MTSTNLLFKIYRSLMFKLPPEVAHSLTLNIAEYIYKSFYDVHTHRVPFTKSSLSDIHKMHNFKQIQVESFIQLPILFNKNIFYPFFKICSVITRIMFPDFLRMKYKWIRFSKEIMLLSIARK